MAGQKKAGMSGLATTRNEKPPKKTSIGHSKNTRYRSKNDKQIKKLYRGQGL